MFMELYKFSRLVMHLYSCSMDLGRDITSIKIRFIGRRNLRIQDQYCGRRHHLSQNQIHWS